MISSLIVEVTLDDTDEFGIELGFQDPVLFTRSLADPPVTISVSNTSPNGVVTTTQQIISQSAVPGFLFNNVALGNNVGLNTSQVGKQGLSNFGVGRVNDNLGFGGLVLSASSESVSALLRALASHRHVQILSNPKVLALDNQEAQIQQGQLVPIVQGVNVNQNTGAVNPVVQQDDAGIILTVTPRISQDGQIVMQVIAEKSQYDLNNGVPLFTDANTGNVVTSPIKDITTANTTAKVQDGQTIVIGGLITKSEDVTESKVPYLGDIPVIGAAFRFDSRRARRTELLIFLTPRIVHGDTDIELIKQDEMERMHFFEDEAEMIYGPLMGVPAESFVPGGMSTMAFPESIAPAAEPAPLMILDPQPDPVLEIPPPELPPAEPAKPIEGPKTLFRKPKLLR
jgi:type II secretory pathway component GspD/PulD (secretin)